MSVSKGAKQLADIFDSKHAKESPASASEELLRYSTAPRQPGCTDILQWWYVTGRVMYPNISFLAKKYLSINATSVSSERLFSLSGNIVNKKRTSMKPGTVNQMVFLAFNLTK